MGFNFTFRAGDIEGWDADTSDLVENRDRELELYSTTIDDSFLNLNASNLTSGTVPSARISGSYTGITAVGLLSGFTSISPGVFYTTLSNRDGVIISGTLFGSGTNRVTITPAPLTGSRTFTLPDVTGTAITDGNLSSITSVGTLVSGSIPATLLTGTVASARLSGSYTGITGLGTLASGLTVTGTVTATTFSGSGASLTSLNATQLTTGGVPGGRLSGSYTGITGVGTLAQELNVSGAACGYSFTDRSGTGERFVWYSSSADAYLYSTRLATNVIGVARTTGITYLYVGVTGNIQYGSYGSMTMYGTNNAWAGISYPDTTSAMMVQNTIFGHYRNNTTWNFYVQNGTFVPSDARYKRDIQPLEHGLNFIREIMPVSYDPLTENLDDEPETTVGKTHYGFTTQNILQALSNAGETRNVAVVDIGGPVTEETNSDRQYLNYSAIIAPMVKAIQELDQRLQQLETV